jgi:hypothetical protein
MRMRLRRRLKRMISRWSRNTWVEWEYRGSVVDGPCSGSKEIERRDYVDYPVCLMK